MSLSKQIKCVRCHNLKTVPIDWEFRECKTCHERTNRRRAKGKIPIEKIEQNAINQLINFENAWTRYKRFVRSHGTKGMSKDEFRTEYLHKQQSNIEKIKAVIAKYDDSRCPIMSHDCLRFRNLLAQRSTYANKEEFSIDLTKQEIDLFYNHIPKCKSCNQYAVLHKYDMPIEPTLNEEGCSQADFDKALDDFFEATKLHDKFEQWEQRQGLTEKEEEKA